MEHIAALLLIVGCSGDLKNCTELPSPVTVYETTEECAAELQPALRAARGSRDKILGQCVFVDPAMEEEDAELVWDVRPNGQLYAVIESTGNQIVAIDRTTTASTSR